MENSCRYLGVIIDNKLSFKQHVNCITNKPSEQCGILSKLRHYVSRLLVLQNYQMNIKPIIQYGLLVYGCTSYTAHVPIKDMKRKIMRIIHFKSFNGSVSKIMPETNTLTVHELYDYELVKFFSRSILKMHAESFLNNLFSFEKISI